MATADEIQGVAIASAKDLIGMTRDAIGAIATAAAGGLFIDDSGWFSGTNISMPGTVTIVEPTLKVSDVPDFKESVTLNKITVGEIPDPGDFEVFIPAINIPASPAFIEPMHPGNAPGLNAVSIPEVPAILEAALPGAPVIPAVSVLDMVALPTYSFGEALPDDELTAPSATFAFSEVDYESDLMTALQGKLQGDLENGGYGIEPLDEIALWERERERELLGMATAIDEAARQVSARGFGAPPGVLNLLVAKAQQEGRQKISSVNRDIALKRADLYVQNRQFAMQQVSALEQAFLQYHTGRMSRALEAAKAVVTLAIESFNALVAKHNARLERYKAAASVYHTLVQSNTVLVQQYSAYIDGVKAKLSVTQVQAEIYRAQLEGLKQAADIYRTKMEAARIVSEIERLRLDAYKTTVEAYSIGVQANTARFNAYEAQIKGEVSKLEAAKVTAETLSAKASAFKARADVVLAKAQADITVNTAKLEEFRGKVSAYEARVHGIGLKNQAVTTEFDSKLKARIASADANIRSQLGRVEASKAQADTAVAIAQVKSATANSIATNFYHNTHSTIGAYQAVASALGGAAGTVFNAAVGINAEITNN